MNSGASNMALQVEVTGIDVDFYEIVVKSDSTTAHLYRRYADLTQLHAQLSDVSMVPTFPHKKSFLSFLFNHSIQLQQYLTQVLHIASNHSALMEFLSVQTADDQVYAHPRYNQPQSFAAKFSAHQPNQQPKSGLDHLAAVAASKLPTVLEDFDEFDSGDDENRQPQFGQYTASSPPMPTRRSLEDYELIKVLGKGCMGKVLLSKERRTGRIYAIKSISKQWVLSHGPQEIEHIRSEQKILAALSQARHPFLVHLHCSFQSPENLFLVLEYISGGDLATQLALFGRFDIRRSLFYTAEIVEGIKELHRMGIIYRDLKPENVLLDSSGHIKLTDFGLSKQFRISHKLTHDQAYCTSSKDCECRDTKTRTFCGTAEYLAPEILLERPYGFEVDWWSLGTFLYEMLIGVTPFYAENHAVMYRRVIEDELRFPVEFRDPNARDLISRLLIRDPKQRLGTGADGADSIKAHPFFKMVNWADLMARRIAAPYIPQVRNPMDVQWFDEAFTKMTPRISPAPISPLKQQQQQQPQDYSISMNSSSLGSDTPLSNFGNGSIVNSQQQPAMQADVFNGYTYISSSAHTYMNNFSELRQAAGVAQQQPSLTSHPVPPASSSGIVMHGGLGTSTPPASNPIKKRRKKSTATQQNPLNGQEQSPMGNNASTSSQDESVKSSTSSFLHDDEVLEFEMDL